MRFATVFVSLVCLTACSDSARPGSVDDDAGVRDAAPRDASLVDAFVLSCTPPEGCRYVGGRTLTSCGTLDCGDAAIADAGSGDLGATAACGGPWGYTCAAGYRCQPPSTDPCGEAAEVGVCVPEPAEGDPSGCRTQTVCGCNGTEYSSDCAAWAAGVDVRRYEACNPTTCLETGCADELDTCTACTTSTGAAYQCLALGEICD